MGSSGVSAAGEKRQLISGFVDELVNVSSFEVKTAEYAVVDLQSRDHADAFSQCFQRSFEDVNFLDFDISTSSGDVFEGMTCQTASRAKGGVVKGNMHVWLKCFGGSAAMSILCLEDVIIIEAFARAPATSSPIVPVMTAFVKMDFFSLPHSQSFLFVCHGISTSSGSG